MSAKRARVDLSRRRLLRGRPAQSSAAGQSPRLPWLKAPDFFDRCTRCAECIRACPEAIVIAGDGGFPVIDFARGGCTFCGACADACPEDLFDDRNRAPWRMRVAIGTDCLACRGVVCESCRDACETGAIRFTPAPGRVPAATLELDRCTGCGACVGVCPADAITWIAHPGASGSARDVA